MKSGESVLQTVYICDAIRTPIGRFGGALSSLRADDLAALPLVALRERNPGVDWDAVDDVIFGCANQAGEDNRNVARMAALLAGFSVTVPGTTVNRLCGSSLDAIAIGARAIKCGEADLIIAGGVESMSRAPFVMGKANTAFSRDMKIEDTTIGWRFVNPRMKALYGVDSMPETAENVARQFAISRADQDAFALRSQQRAAQALATGFFDREILPVEMPARKGSPVIGKTVIGKTVIVDRDEHPRGDTSAADLARLKGIVTADGTVTAGNAAGVNDGSGALLLASQQAVSQYGLTPKARIVTSAVVGVEPRIMGFGAAPAMEKALGQGQLTIADMDVIEVNEAFAAQVLAVLRNQGIADDDPRVNSNGGAIALGHPLGASGARLVTTALNQLQRGGGRYGLCSMCIGVGQGIALLIEKI